MNIDRPYSCASFVPPLRHLISTELHSPLVSASTLVLHINPSSRHLCHLCALLYSIPHYRFALLSVSHLHLYYFHPPRRVPFRSLDAFVYVATFLLPFAFITCSISRAIVPMSEPKPLRGGGIGA
ncbi:hypothetical protein BDN71DRAFT_1162061 [Pleurotus eryngii]|uniref:Uncharacterized protein n=1 Tax=Pleurotus eryngii TaxID=5323 RepID=A0A9P5ZSQ2_PLEER|nr:hypothetical protein BDN71DRAFT_1162061 [Pleurotus eryngii]